MELTKEESFLIVQEETERSMVEWMGLEMKAKLIANRHKGMWRHESQAFLLNRAVEKLGQLSLALKSKDELQARLCAASVANFVAMACETRKP